MIFFIFYVKNLLIIIDPEVINFYHAQMSMKFQLLIKTKLLTNNSAFKVSDFVFNMLILNVKILTIVGILTLKSKINFMLLSWALEKFYNL